MKYFIVNLKKNTYTDLCAEDYKTFDEILVKGIKDGLIKWRGLLCSWSRRFNMVKKSVLPTWTRN